MPDDQLEDAALDRVVEWLRERGEVVSILSRPDVDRRGKPQSSGVPTPDARLSVNGREVLIDIAELHQHSDSVRQHKALGKLITNLETRMRAAVREAGLGLVVASGSFAELPPRRRLVAAEQQVFDRMKSTLPLLRDGNGVEVSDLPSFVNRLFLSVAGERTSFAWMFDDQMHGGFVVGILQEALDRIVKKKRRQLEGAEEGWLIVIEQTFLAVDEDFAQAIPLLTEAIPENWKRVILVRPWSNWAVSGFRIG
jgi:hypothetical protein